MLMLHGLGAARASAATTSRTTPTRGAGGGNTKGFNVGTIVNTASGCPKGYVQTSVGCAPPSAPTPPACPRGTIQTAKGCIAEPQPTAPYVVPPAPNPAPPSPQPPMIQAQVVYSADPATNTIVATPIAKPISKTALAVVGVVGGIIAAVLLGRH